MLHYVDVLPVTREHGVAQRGDGIVYIRVCGRRPDYILLHSGPVTLLPQNELGRKRYNYFTRFDQEAMKTACIQKHLNP
jgi:hypothetical protein